MKRKVLIGVIAITLLVCTVFTVTYIINKDLHDVERQFNIDIPNGAIFTLKQPIEGFFGEGYGKYVLLLTDEEVQEFLTSNEANLLLNELPLTNDQIEIINNMYYIEESHLVLLEIDNGFYIFREKIEGLSQTIKLVILDLDTNELILYYANN